MTMAQIVALAGHYPSAFWGRAMRRHAYTFIPESLDAGDGEGVGLAGVAGRMGRGG